jgi:ubiquinone/menaquinone biosynthesis C-methylase UbiE
MIEYSTALRSAPISGREVVLDVGSYYSFFPSYFSSHSYTISLDINRNAMIFQRKVAKTMGKNISERLECVIADSTKLPLRDDTLDKVFVISTIEHIAKDSITAKECARVLNNDGCCVMSFPFSKSAKKSQIEPYFQRFYTRKMILDRIVVPSMLSLEKLFTFSKTFLSSFYAAVPQGWLILKDLVIGVTLFRLEEIFLPKSKEGTLAVIELRKHC